MRPIMDEECKKVEDALEMYPDLKRYFNNETQKEFFNQKDRLKQNPLFFYLLRNGNAEKLVGNLKILEEKCDKFHSILKKIHERDYEVFHSYISEIDILSYYYSKASDDFQIEYEPEIKEKGSKIDAKITVKDKNYFLEIFTLFRDERFKKIDDIALQIRLKLDVFEKNPYIIFITIYDNFEESFIDSFVEEIKKIIEDTSPKKEVSEEFGIVAEKEILIDNKPIGKARFNRGKKDKGFVGGFSTPVQKVEDAGRLKNRILEKIDKQLPSNDGNIVIINLSKIMGDGFYDIDDAVFGQKGVLIDKKTMKARDNRHQNGVVHHKKGKHISLIIPYIKDDFSTRIFFMNDLTASKVFTKEEVKLF